MYSNLMYGLASRMTEVIAGERWEDLAERYFFRPLDMHRSTFVTQLDLSELNTAKPYQNYFGVLKPISSELLRYRLLFFVRLSVSGNDGKRIESGMDFVKLTNMATWTPFCPCYSD